MSNVPLLPRFLVQKQHDKSYFEYLIADYFPTLNKKDPVDSFIQLSSTNLLHANSQIGHVADGTHKLLEPVSKITLNNFPGVPSSIGP